METPSHKPQKYQNKDIPSLTQATVTAALRGEIQTPEQANKMMKELAYRAKIKNPDLAIRIDAAKARLDSTLFDLIGSNLTEKKEARRKALLDISRILEPENFSSRLVDIKSSTRALKSRFNILQQHFSTLLYYQNTVENSDPFALRQKELAKNMIGIIKKQFKNTSVSLTELNQSMETLSNLLGGRDQTGKISNESLAFQRNLNHSQQTIERREITRQKKGSLICQSIYENITSPKPHFYHLSGQIKLLIKTLNQYSDLAKTQIDIQNYFIKAFPGLNFSADYNEIGKVTNIQVTTIAFGPDNKYHIHDYIIFPVNKAKPSYPEAVRQVIKVAKKYTKSNSREA